MSTERLWRHDHRRVRSVSDFKKRVLSEMKKYGFWKYIDMEPRKARGHPTKQLHIQYEFNTTSKNTWTPESTARNRASQYSSNHIQMHMSEYSYFRSEQHRAALVTQVPSGRVSRAETRLTVYHSPYIMMLCLLVADLWGKRIFIYEKTMLVVSRPSNKVGYKLFDFQ